MSTQFKKLPSNLSFQRLVIVSDGLFYNLHKDGGISPLTVIRHGLRGTQNINGKKKNGAEAEVANVQITESAKSAADASAALVRFSMSFVPLSKAIFSCAGEGAPDLRKAIEDFLGRAYQSEGLRNVANRYARNILGGRWLWRNRVLASALSVSVSVDEEKTPRFSQDALSTSQKDFNDFNESELALGALIQEALEGSSAYRFHVDARVDFGFTGAVEVFPSQNFVQSSPKGFSRPLYKVDVVRPKGQANAQDFEDVRVMGQAALRDQKIGNALRTIDTWYSEYAIHGQPIPVEPTGANLDSNKFFREKGDSSFKILCGVSGLDPDSDEGRFLIASLIRGGVYGESNKSDDKKKGKKKAGNDEDAGSEGVSDEG